MFETVEIKEVKSEIGALVKALRKQRGHSQSQLAKSLGVSRTSIQNLELGKNFTIDTLLKVLKEMQVLEQLQGELIRTKAHVLNSKSLY